MAPKVSLSMLILAGVLSDVLWIFFFFVGIEQVTIQPGIMVANSLNLVYIPFSHSLVMDAAWGGLFAGVAAPRGQWPIRNGGGEALVHVLIDVCIVVMGAGILSID